MKTQEEIDDIYKRLYLSLDDSPHYHTWVRGYTQCQEDMAIEITELKMICQEYSKDVKALNDMLSSIVLHPQTWS